MLAFLLLSVAQVGIDDRHSPPGVVCRVEEPRECADDHKAERDDNDDERRHEIPPWVHGARDRHSCTDALLFGKIG